MSRFFVYLGLFFATHLIAPSAIFAVTIPTVPVGNAGNAGEIQSQGVFGAVPYKYQIGAYEVTNSQYAEFLNAKAASDLFGLYNQSMASDYRGGIVRAGASGNYSYSVKSNMGDRPVNYVSWYDALRFANWLNNGQGASDYNTGAYTVLSYQPSNVTRNADAKWFLPTENEWYKAAYYDPRPAAAGGPTGDDHYWRYPTSSDSPPVEATADIVGNISNPGANVANYNAGADSVTTVGSAGPLSKSYFGTSDQGGNVYEWNEAVHPTPIYHGLRGSAFADNLQRMDAASQDFGTDEYSYFGFRVATVPEPSTLALATLGALALVAINRRRRHRPAALPQHSTVILECEKTTVFSALPSSGKSV